jgi:TetR/AcrR family transcriptional regulator, repressor for uid operon
MSNGTRRETPKGEARRRQVLDAATECFRQEGIHSSSISRISRTSGMSPGHIYHYFESKEAIVEAIAERQEHENVELLDSFQADTKGGDVATRLARRIPEVVTRGTNPANTALTLELAAEASRNPAVAQIIQRMDKGITDRFVRLIEDVGMPACLSSADVLNRVDFIALMINGLPLRAQMNPDLDVEAMTTLLCDVIRFLLEPPRG